MDKKLVGLIGAVAGLATAGGAQAAIDPPALSEALHASSYADLLAPIANPVELLKADNAAREQQAAIFRSRKVITRTTAIIPTPDTIITPIIITTITTTTTIVHIHIITTITIITTAPLSASRVSAGLWFRAD